LNHQGVLFLLGRLLVALSAALLIPAVAAAFLGGDEARAFFMAAGIAGVVGILVERTFRRGLESPFRRREAFMLVAVTWVMASVVGALPYIFIKGPGFIIDGLFESASGFTTTGASILDHLESEPPGLLLWRSLTQWLGGMGIIVLGIAILPKLAVGGMQLLGAEAPGPATEKLTPRIAQTAKALWGIYVLFTALQCGVLIWLGMGPFDAINHAFTTMATGGFSTNASSIGAYGGAIQIAVTVFMLLAGVNFVLHFNLLRGRPLKLAGDAELRFYIGVVTVAALLLAADLLIHNEADGVLDALRLGAFQSTAIVSTTGFATADFDAWPHFSRSLLFMLMFVGGCAGSTAGSVKVVRVLIVFKKLGVELKRFLQPRGVFPVRVGRRAIPDDIVSQVTTFFLLFLALFATGGLLLSMTGLDLVSAFSASAACLGNVGPGFGQQPE
jgi:trk system potassium uptake protein TrkH